MQLAEAKQLTEVDQLKQAYCKAMVAIAKEIPQEPTLSDIERLTPSVPHLQEAATALEPWLVNDDLIVFTGIASFCQGQANYTAAEQWHEQRLTVAKNRLGDSHPEIAHALNNLAYFHSVFKGDFKKGRIA